MKETVALDVARAPLVLPERLAGERAKTAKLVAQRSLIVWGEHCSECAAPACYTACNFYTPRPDGHCRRFVHGIETVEHGGPTDIPLTRIRFRRWGKLEGRGPVRALGLAEAARLEQAARPALGLGLAVLARKLARDQTNHHRALAQGKAEGFDSFMVEGAALSGDDLAFTLTIMPTDKQNPALFQTRFSLTRDWSRTTIPLADITRHLDLSFDHLIQIEPVGEAEGVEALFGLCDFVSLAKADNRPSNQMAAPIMPATKAKVVVWDLDHTIWDGILVEDGAEGLRVRPGIREVIEALDARGILQSVASKNDHAPAMAALRHHGLSDYLLVPQIGWGPKSASLTRIADALNLGLDSFVFIDDQPFERGEVGETHPSVTVFNEVDALSLLDRPQFDVPITAESRGRRALYAVEAARAQAAEAADGNMDDFLRNCALVLDLAPLGSDDIERVYELSQRTNQLNVAATRFTREEVAALATPKNGVEAWTMRCRDRFGDYGLIGFAHIKPDVGQMLDFFMSCRVQRKRVEAAFLGWLAEHCAGAEVLTIQYRKTARNDAALAMFEALGFTLRTTGEGEGDLRLTLPTDVAGADIVKVQITQATQAALAAQEMV